MLLDDGVSDEAAGADPGRLRLTAAGSADMCVLENCASALPTGSTPSGEIGDVTILHDCRYPSRLRFTRPRGDAEVLDVREKSDQK